MINDGDVVSNNKRILKNSIFLYLRMFFTMAVSLYTVRVVLRTLTEQDYGIYGAVGGVILSFGFLSSVLSNASQRFFSFELGKIKDRRIGEVFSTIFLTFLGLSVIIVLLSETIGMWFLNNKMTIPTQRLSAAIWVFQFALFSFLLTILTSPFQALIIAYEKMDLYAYLSILDVVLKLLIVYALQIFEIDKLKLYAVLVFLTSLISNSIYIIYCFIKHPEIRLRFFIDKNILKSVFSYSSWTLFGTLAGMCNTQGMNLSLNVFFGPIANSAYTISSQIYHTVASFANNFYVAVKPALIKNYSAGNVEYVLKLFYFSSKTIFSLLFIVVLPIVVCTNEILQIWLGQVSEYMVTFVQLSLIYTIVLTISYPITAVVQASGQVKLYHCLVDGFSLLALPTMILLFKLGFSANYAYVVSICVFGIAHFLRVYVLKKVFPMFSVRLYLLSFIIPSCVVAILGLSISMFIKHLLNDGFLMTVLLCLISIIVALILIVFILFRKHELEMVVNIIKRKAIKS